MNLEKYNRQLKPCFQCRTPTAQIERNDNAVGVICDCGVMVVFGDAKTPLKDIVEWWNKKYGFNDE